MHRNIHFSRDGVSTKNSTTPGYFEYYTDIVATLENIKLKEPEIYEKILSRMDRWIQNGR